MFTQQQINHALSLLLNDPDTHEALESMVEHVLGRSSLGEDDEPWWYEMTVQTNLLLTSMITTNSIGLRG